MVDVGLKVAHHVIMELAIRVEVKEGQSGGIVVGSGSTVEVDGTTDGTPPVLKTVIDMVAFQPLDGTVNCGTRVDEVFTGVGPDV